MRTQVAIIGGAPGGSNAAMQLRRHGVDTVIIEQETFPRYHIGESMTGEAGALLRNLGLGDRMIADRDPRKQGVTSVKISATLGRPVRMLASLSRCRTTS